MDATMNLWYNPVSIKHWRLLMGKLIDLTGKRFGRLKAIGIMHTRPKEGAYWGCQCDCGMLAIVRGQSLRQGSTESCGCLRDEQASKTHKKHGRSFDRLYKVWVSMKQRCYNENAAGYSRYGGRGIKVCDEWLESFEAFADDMGDKPMSVSIDRINNDGDYAPENCRWATASQQGRNKRATVMITYNEVTKPLIEWAEELNVPYERLRRRRRIGWSDTEIIEGR